MKKKPVGRPRGGMRGMRVRDYPQISVRVPPRVLTMYRRWCRKVGRSMSKYLETCIRDAVGEWR